MGYVFLFICFLKVPVGESEKKDLLEISFLYKISETLLIIDKSMGLLKTICISIGDILW